MGCRIERGIRWIVRTQIHPSRFILSELFTGERVIERRYDDFSFFRRNRLIDYYEISVENIRSDHRISFDTKDKSREWMIDQILRNIEGTFYEIIRRRRESCCDRRSHQWNTIFLRSCIMFFLSTGSYTHPSMTDSSRSRGPPTLEADDTSWSSGTRMRGMTFWTLHRRKYITRIIHLFYCKSSVLFVKKRRDACSYSLSRSRLSSR